MLCSHPNCTGHHRTSDGTNGRLCPAALIRRRAGQLRRYHERYKEKARETRRRYYLANREHLLAKANRYWREHRAQMITRAIERNRRLHWPQRSGVKAAYVPPEDSKTWWKLKESEIPRRWILEAA